ncbi:enoyl-ACP reductase FabI [Deferrisoma camini]|uniref:enoyl-ACP reductase FabI n=1 Tax=Deferrisoma camini TaxID=1035120 RepID=UPI00046D880F|nr:SDR family oxidoreductase [Deferrisoma camini]
MSDTGLNGSWALILGASSGFGAATARALARKGVNIFGVHLDRKATLPQVEALVEELRGTGVRVRYFNVNAADEAKRREVLDAVAAECGEGPKVRVLMHSLAFGALRSFVGDPAETLTKAQMEMTLDVMAHSLVYWTQDLVARDLFDRNGRVFAMTSSGGQRVWAYYGAVSAAKAALESHIRQLALELAPRGITANAIRAGVTDTPALRKIPGHEQMVEVARSRNPMGRLTTPEDVAEAIALLSEPASHWITGNVIGVDGGEDITG